MDPKTFRDGSKNFRFDFEDNWIKANGFQHKAAFSSLVPVGVIEYKFTDLNSGEANTEILSVCTDGNLYRKKANYLKFSSLGTSVSYSFYYDEVADTYKFKLNSYAEINVSDTMTMDQLRVAINAQGATCTIVDDDGATVTGSTCLAYLIDVVINQVLVVNQTVETASSWFLEQVEYPSKSVSLTEVPFVTTKNYYSSNEYEGISYTNLNNCVYISDGGFPLKYDGKQVYRAGVPKILAPYLNGQTNYSGFDLTSVQNANGTLYYDAVYQYAFRLAYYDSQGVKVTGTFDRGNTVEFMKGTVGNSNNCFALTYNQVDGVNNFPFYACQVNGTQNIPDAGGSLNVQSGHNIKAGMILRIPVSNNLVALTGYSYIYSKVASVTATTITLEKGKTSGVVPYPFNNIQSLSATRTSGSPNITNMFVQVANHTAVAASTTVTVTSTANIRVGDDMASTFFTGTPTVTRIIDATTIVVSFGATSSGSGATANFSTGQRVSIGSLVTGTGITAGTTFTGLGVSKFVGVLSANATASGTSTLTFTQYNGLVYNGQWLNAGYGPDELANTIGSPNLNFAYLPEIKVGAFLEVYRTQRNASTMLKMIELPIANNRTDIIFNDVFNDSELSSELLIDADEGSELPRACKYITQWQDQLVQGGRPVDPSLFDDYYPTSTGLAYVNQWNEPDLDYRNYKYTEAGLCDDQSIYWADSLTPEGFPQDGLHEFRIESLYNDRVTGVIKNKDALFAFKERSTAILVGSLAENNVSLELLEADVGCVSHRSLQEVQGTVVWLDQFNGFYSCVAGRLPVHIGWKISDYQKDNTQGLDYRQAVSANFRKLSLYVCSVGSTTFVYDYASINEALQPRNAWYLWDRFNVKGLLATANDELLISDGTYIWKMKITNTKYDDTDHKSAINMVINMAWLTQGSPIIDKHYLGLWINSITGDFTLTVKQYGNFIDTMIADMTISFPAESPTKKTVKNDFKSNIAKLSGVSYGLENNEKNRLLKINGVELGYSADFDAGEPKT